MLKRDLEQHFGLHNKEGDSLNKLRPQEKKMLHNDSQVTMQEIYYTWHL